MSPLIFLLAFPLVLCALIFWAICAAAKDPVGSAVDYLEFGRDHAYTPTNDELADIMPFDFQLEAELRDERKARAALRPSTGNVQNVRRVA